MELFGTHLLGFDSETGHKVRVPIGVITIVLALRLVLDVIARATLRALRFITRERDDREMNDRLSRGILDTPTRQRIAIGAPTLPS